MTFTEGAMRLIPVEHPRIGQRILCIGCQRMVNASVMMADLNGPALKAYWCPACLLPDDGRRRLAYRGC